MHSDNRILFSDKKKWAVKPEKTWRSLKCLLLSERSQSEKAAHCLIPIMWHSGKRKTIETVKRLVVAKIYRKGREEEVEDRGFLGQQNYFVWYYDSGCIYYIFV